MGHTRYPLKIGECSIITFPTTWWDIVIGKNKIWKIFLWQKNRPFIIKKQKKSFELFTHLGFFQSYGHIFWSSFLFIRLSAFDLMFLSQIFVLQIIDHDPLDRYYFPKLTNFLEWQIFDNNYKKQNLSKCFCICK